MRVLVHDASQWDCGMLKMSERALKENLIVLLVSGQPLYR